jgi:hypothetical protein
MKLLYIPLMLFASSAFAVDLVGKVVPPYPEGTDSRSGSCVGQALGPGRTCDYAIGTLSEDDFEEIAILAQRKTGESDGKAIWIVTDQIPWPLMEENEHLSIGTCRLNGESISPLTAVVKVSDSEWFAATGWARSLNLETGKFEEVNASNIECINEGWGL